MTNKWLEELSTRALSDAYFKELFLKAELIYVNQYFNTNIDTKLVDKEFFDLLRFADILSRSQESQFKNYAYKIVSLLVDKFKDNSDFQFFTESILIKIGNFPAIRLIEESFVTQNIQLPLENVLEKIIKSTVQAIPNTDLIFTDIQYKIYQALQNSNHFSFSGPTSLGKSFIIEAFIQTILNNSLKKENIVILVPTKALINQVSVRIEKAFPTSKILTHPLIPNMVRDLNNNYIFVFTPERLIAYLAESNNPKIDYLFIDEAQKVIADGDSRSPLYYHAIVQAEKKSIKLYFASPNIPNAEIFLELFDKSTLESITVQDSPVSQNRFFIDLVELESIYFSEFNGDIQLLEKDRMRYTDCNYWFKQLGDSTKNIIYCNSISDTISYALNFASTMPIKEDLALKNLVNEIANSIHKEYYLIDCLKRGVAYHFGQLLYLIS